VILEIATQQFLWVANAAVGAFLLVLLVMRKNYRLFPACSLYVLVNFTAGVVAFFVYHRWGFSSLYSWRIAWGMQGIAISARALAVAELCRHLLKRYRGIWALAWRILLPCTALVFVYSIVAATHVWGLAPLASERALELSIAAVVVGVLLLTRYYEVQVNATDRLIAAGFCLYSCFCVLNDTILESYLRRYVVLWNLLRMLAFLASQLIWIWALRNSQTRAVSEEEHLPLGVHKSVAPLVNLHLRSLSDCLSQLRSSKGPRH